MQKLLMTTVLPLAALGQNANIDYLSQLKNQPLIYSDISSSQQTLSSVCASIPPGAYLALTKIWLNEPSETLNCNLLALGGRIQAARNATITINGNVLISPMQYTFDGTTNAGALFKFRHLSLNSWAMFGADNTGTRDSTAAIQQSLNVCNVVNNGSGYNNGLSNAPGGVYKISATIHWYRGCSIVGEPTSSPSGDFLTLIVWNGPAAGTMFDTPTEQAAQMRFSYLALKASPVLGTNPAAIGIDIKERADLGFDLSNTQYIGFAGTTAAVWFEQGGLNVHVHDIRCDDNSEYCMRWTLHGCCDYASFDTFTNASRQGGKAGFFHLDGGSREDGNQFQGEFANAKIEINSKPLDKGEAAFRFDMNPALGNPIQDFIDFHNVAVTSDVGALQGIQVTPTGGGTTNNICIEVMNSAMRIAGITAWVPPPAYASATTAVIEHADICPNTAESYTSARSHRALNYTVGEQYRVGPQNPGELWESWNDGQGNKIGTWGFDTSRNPLMDFSATPKPLTLKSGPGGGNLNGRWQSTTLQGFGITLSTPGSSTAPCVAGSMWADANYVYVCTAQNTIKRAPLSPF